MTRLFSQVLCGVAHRHCYVRVVEQRRAVLRCVICGHANEGIARHRPRLRMVKMALPEAK